ncbi:MAG: hypothetical protein IB617_03145 [Candidatus Nealsonbacteria bacterium]|nr:MAG: hypothetical protein IB617_03145 [Candidatus Nealsonbacteria bacterium]
MKCFKTIEDQICVGIPVDQNPYPHVTLGEGGHKRATWVSIGKRDVDIISSQGKILRAGVIALRDKETKELTGKFLIVAERPTADNRILLLWRIKSGYRGSAGINADRNVQVIAIDSSWHSGGGALGETAEILVVLNPGDELRAHRTGRRVENKNYLLLRYDGKNIEVKIGDENIIDNGNYEGDYL